MGAAPPPMIGAWQVGPDDLDAPFWSGLERNELRVQRCTGCDGWIWAPQWRCGACGSWDLVWEAVAPRGRVFTWTRTWHRVAAEVADAVPYVTVLVDVADADGVRMLGIWIDAGDPVIGAEAEIAWGAEGRSANPRALCWTAAGDVAEAPG